MTTPTDPTTPPTDEAPGSEDDHKYQPGADGLCSCQRDTPPTDEALRALVEEGLEAFRLTREYVGEDTLPNVAGWSHFDWSTKARAVLAAARAEVDVERLARALHDQGFGCNAYRCSLGRGSSADAHEQDARFLADAYRETADDR